ncbi:forkhead domain-containing protein [Colletotrichum truncatum]|uniref:Forkhead domain-containing protein n=1 Tax=Colletotrichum truncatum TaxID=5467 RepID=A0ACC3YUM6_COLTU|nr:forkhead domain-containing protein [Colletotrichum truncatum]KAF6785794.1 forkhead domain-containing protein [Colletotrichum truncatum]
MPVHSGLNHSPIGISRSPEPLSMKADIAENYYPLVPEQQVPVNNSYHSFYTPNQFSAVSQQFHSPSMSQSMWASPRSSVDDFENYSYHGQAPTSYNAASLSPRTWPSSIQTPPPQYEVPFHHQQQYDGLPGDQLPMCSDEIRGAPLNIPGEYSSTCFQQGFGGPHNNVPSKYESPPPMVSSGSPYMASPISIEENFENGSKPPLSRSSSPVEQEGPLHPPDCQSKNEAAQKAAAKDEDEPYAQLIWKALKAQESRSMTLQQLYQWFLDNTDKPEKAGGLGWHNSIRHNLSMNHAFVRKEEPIQTNFSSSTSCTNEKRPSKWYLLPEFEDGVRSTTYYRGSPRGGTRHKKRKDLSPVHVGHQRHRQATYHPSPNFPNRTMPGRAMSGRRGGKATTRSKSIARNLRVRTSPVNSPILMPHQNQHWGSPQRVMSTSMPTYSQDLSQNSNARFFIRDEEQKLGLNADAASNIPHHGLSMPIRTAQPPYQFADYSMTDVTGVYQHPQQQYQQHPQQQYQQHPQQHPQSHPRSDNVLYGWGNSTNHGL